MSSSLISYLKSEAERRHLRGTLSRYLSPKLAEQIAQHPEKLRLGGETRTMTFHFCDIRGFTSISEQFDPHGLTHFINGFLTPMTDIIFANNGTVDKYMGDCIMAFWNAPLDDPNHERNAFAAALAMQQRLDDLNRELAAEAQAHGQPLRPLRTAIGINSGPCCVGNMGSQYRFDYSILGDAVNVAARLAELAAERDIDLLIGEDTASALVGEALTPIDAVAIRGRAHAERVYTIASIAARHRIALG
jgi:adenylate cyclase